MGYIRSSAVAALAALALFAAQAGPPISAQTTASPADAAAPSAGPVAIDQFSVVPSAGKFPRPTVFLSFRNTSAKVEDEVHFLVRYRDGAATIVDKGVFSPGIVIRHQFSAPFGAPIHGDAPVGSVQYVHFADGTHWDGR